MRRVLGVGAGVACALLVAACGGTTTGTSASSTPTIAQPPTLPITSPDKLDAGTYPTKPRPPIGTAGTPAGGAIAQAQQMADFVIGPWDVDETLITPYLESFYLMGNPGVLSRIGPEPVAAAAAQHGFVNGFASAREATDKAALVHAVMRFADPAAAAAASADMDKAASGKPIAGALPTVAAIPGHPEAAASTYPFTPHGSDRVRATIRSFTPHGPYVFMDFVQSIDGFDAAAAMVAKAVDMQAPQIDKFTPADLNALAAVPLDPTGMLARTVPLTSNASAAKNAVYGPRGAAHFQSNPVGSETLFKDTGVTEVAMAGTNVYAARSAPSAGMVIGSFTDELAKTEGTTLAAPVPNIPESHCFAFPKAFYCVAPADRYAIEATGDTLDALHQMVAAQYIILTAK
jgi:hypothetical protein